MFIANFKLFCVSEILTIPLGHYMVVKKYKNHIMGVKVVLEKDTRNSCYEYKVVMILLAAKAKVRGHYRSAY